MADRFRHVTSGQPLRIPADDWNAAVDAAKAHHGRSQGLTTTPMREHPDTSFWAEVQGNPYGYDGYDYGTPHVFTCKRWLSKRSGEEEGQAYGDEFEVRCELNYTAGAIVRVAKIGEESDGTPIYRMIEDGGDRVAILTQDPDGTTLYGKLAYFDGSDWTIENPAADEIEFLVPFMRGNLDTLTPGETEWAWPEIYSGCLIRCKYDALSDVWYCLNEFHLAQEGCDAASSS